MKDFDLCSAFNLQSTILTWIGFYPDNSPGILTWKKLREAINFVSLTIFMVHMFLLLFSYSFDEMIVPSRIWITEFIFFFKLLMFMRNRKVLEQIEEVLKKGEVLDFSREYLENAKSDLIFMKKLCNNYLIFVVGYVAFYMSYPLYTIRNERYLPIDGYLPCSLKQNYCYIGLYIFQVANSFISVFTNCSLDLLFCILVKVNCFLWDIVKQNLMNTDYSNFQKAKFELRRSIMLHIEALWVVEKTNELFSWVLFFHCLGSMFSICLAIFSITQTPLSSALIEICQFFVVIFGQIGFPCWVGNDLLDKNTEVQEALYMSNWYKSDLKLRPSIRIIMERTKRPVNISAGGFFVLSFATLTRILNSSYSFLTLLLRVYN